MWIGNRCTKCAALTTTRFVATTSFDQELAIDLCQECVVWFVRKLLSEDWRHDYWVGHRLAEYAKETCGIV